MTIHKCDICNRDMGKWLKITVDAESKHIFTNVSDLLGRIGRYDICPACFDKLRECASSLDGPLYEEEK